jgi:hypothetical protein
MNDAESKYLLELWDLNICPNCGQFIQEGTRVGNGHKADGGFCSLNCYTAFYASEIVHRAKNISELMERIRNN